MKSDLVCWIVCWLLALYLVIAGKVEVAIGWVVAGICYKDSYESHNGGAEK